MKECDRLSTSLTIMIKECSTQSQLRAPLRKLLGGRILHSTAAASIVAAAAAAAATAVSAVATAAAAVASCQ